MQLPTIAFCRSECHNTTAYKLSNSYGTNILRRILRCVIFISVRLVVFLIDGFLILGWTLFILVNRGQQSRQLCSTIAETLFSYSRLFSWYSWAAWLLAGLFGFGSSSKDFKYTTGRVSVLCF